MAATSPATRGTASKSSMSMVSPNSPNTMLSPFIFFAKFCLEGSLTSLLLQTLSFYAPARLAAAAYCTILPGTFCGRHSHCRLWSCATPRRRRSRTRRSTASSGFERRTTSRNVGTATHCCRGKPFGSLCFSRRLCGSVCCRRCFAHRPCASLAVRLVFCSFSVVRDSLPPPAFACRSDG